MIKNTTQNQVLAKEHVFCTSFFSKARGLMFSRPKALVMDFKKEKIIPLHMLLVFFPIDVLFLNQKKVVVEVKRNFRPFSFYTPKKKARFLVELPYEAKAGVGDKIQIKEKII